MRFVKRQQNSRISDEATESAGRAAVESSPRPSTAGTQPEQRGSELAFLLFIGCRDNRRCQQPSSGASETPPWIDVPVKLPRNTATQPQRDYSNYAAVEVTSERELTERMSSKSEDGIFCQSRCSTDKWARNKSEPMAICVCEYLGI